MNMNMETMLLLIVLRDNSMSMVYILYGNLRHAQSKLYYLVSVRHTHQIESSYKFAPKRPIFLLACATSSDLPSNVGTMSLTVKYL